MRERVQESGRIAGIFQHLVKFFIVGYFIENGQWRLAS